MTISTITQNKKFKKIISGIAAAVFWIIIWEAASLLVSEDLKLFLPSPFSVMKRWGEIALTSQFLISCGATLARIFAGFAIGCIAGISAAVLTSSLKLCDILISPMLKVIRAVPVVSFIILAFLFIDVDNLPVFISFLMVVPLIWQTTHDSIASTDIKLLEMGRVYGLKPLTVLFKIKLGSNRGAIITSCVSGLGFAWKSGVAAEVLCTPMISIGKNIYRAKGNLDFDEVYALTLTVVVLSLLFEVFLKYLCKKYVVKGEKNA